MKNILLIVLATSLPAFAADMNFTPKADISLSGKIATVKNSKKYRTVEACQAFCSSRTSCAAFTLDTEKGSCTLLKSITKETVNTKAVSGIKN